MSPSIQWAAELANVREVSLRGTADLAFWTDRLKPEDLLPAERDGHAQILIVAADAKFKGIRFRELSFSVLVAQPAEGAYLVRAFNSCRFFAFCERMFFSTPYYHGDVRMSASDPIAIRLLKNSEAIFAAEMPTREPARSGDDGWEGPIFLPRRGKARRLFYARIRGHTRTYPLLPGRDMLTIRSTANCEVLQALTDSHFVAREWAVRESATHAKSKTYNRSDAAERERVP
jgi:hypothetical protein